MYILLMLVVVIFQLVAIFFVVKWAQRYGYWKAAMVIDATVQLNSGDFEVLKEFEPSGLPELFQAKTGVVTKLMSEVYEFNNK